MRGRVAGTALVALLLGVPLLLALVGPVLVGEASPRGAPYVLGPGHPLGTDFVGRDVLEQLLLGGRAVVLVTAGAVVVTYALGVPLGLAAAMTRLRWLDELLMRPMDVLLALPSLLLLLLLATSAPPGRLTLVGIIAVVNLPYVARVARGTALEIASRPAVEAMRLQGEGWWRIAVGYVARAMLRPLAADAGTRLTGALYLVATASFLGIGVAPDASDWPVMVDRNRPGVFVQPWGVVVPAALIIALSAGVNLLSDRLLKRRGHPVPDPGHPAPDLERPQGGHP